MGFTIIDETLRDDLQRVDLNVGFARAVVDGVVHGEVWVSSAAPSGAAHVQHPYGMSLVWGDRVDLGFDEIIERLTRGAYRHRDEYLQIDPRWANLPWEQRLGTTVSAVHTRVNFDLNVAEFRGRDDLLRVSDGWMVRPATAADFELSGSVVPREFWRDADQFLVGGGGWCAEHAGVVGALAFSSFRCDDTIELGIETAPAARRQGLASAVAATMISDLLAQGLTPVWACREGNVGSYRLARRLGFLPIRRVPYYQLGA